MHHIILFLSMIFVDIRSNASRKRTKKKKTSILIIFYGIVVDTVKCVIKETMDEFLRIEKKKVDYITASHFKGFVYCITVTRLTI
jgi:hypothetical protein